MTNEVSLAYFCLLRARFILSAFVIVGMVMICSRGALAEEPTRHFDLPSQDLVSALRAFGYQADIQILFGYDDSESAFVDSVRTSRVVGEFTVREAVARMLEGTGLQFKFTAPNKIAVFRPSEPDVAPAVAQSSAASIELRASPMSIDEVHVTGTRLRGALDVISPTVIADRRELRKGTFATVQDALYLLPLNSLAGPREDWGAAGNTGFGAGINLRQLGVGATLVLLNGYRQPASGEEAAFSDVSNIPWSAVDRIEIVPDGSSALYGSDAVAGVVNIIMREDLDGAESEVRFTSVPGGADELQASQLFGKRWTSGNALLAYQYSRRAPLAAADRDYAASSDKRPFGGSDHRTYYAGNILDLATLQPVLGIPATGVTTAGDYSPVINLANEYEQVQLLPERQVHNAFLTVTQALNQRWSIRAEGRYAVRDTTKQQFPAEQILFVPRSNPFYVDPFPEQLVPGALVAYSFLQDFGRPFTYVSTTRTATSAVSATASLPYDWQLAISHSYGREELRAAVENIQSPAAVSAVLNETDPARAFNPFGRNSPDVIDLIRHTRLVSALSTVSTTAAIADGPLAHMAAGVARLAVGAEYRREGFDYFQPGGAIPQAPQGITIANQRYVGSAFAEVSAPLIGNPRDSRAAPRLEFSAAGRFESYSDFGHTFNPRLGLKWAPFDEFKLRATWGRSFRAPTLVDRDMSRNASGIASLADPKSPSGRSVIVALQGNNPDLREETATTWTAGLDYVPTHLSGLKLSLTYFDVDYADRIGTPARNGPSEILLHEDQWASAINRHPTQAQIDAICQRADFFGPGTCAEAMPSIIVDLRKTNLSETELRGLDADVSWELESGIGSLAWRLMGSYILEFGQRDSAASPIIDALSTVHNPPALKARAWGEWSQHPSSGFAAAAGINYISGFRDTESALIRRVRPWTTVDLQLSYQTSATGGWLAGVDVALNAVNVLDASPPFVDRAYGYDFANVQPIGRTISLEFTKSW